MRFLPLCAWRSGRPRLSAAFHCSCEAAVVVEVLTVVVVVVVVVLGNTRTVVESLPWEKWRLKRN